jgi:hypothetical protein
MQLGLASDRATTQHSDHATQQQTITSARRNARKRLNPPPPFRGTGVLDKKSILPISSFRPPRTLRRATVRIAPKSQNLNFSCFSTVFGPFKNLSNFDIFSKPPKITKIGARAQNGWILVDF